jgi:membrane protein DedA with SNARE-associated domain
MRPAWLAGAAALTLYGLVRRKAHGRVTLALLAAAAAAALLVGAGLVQLPDVEGLIEDAGQTLGTWTYALVAGLAFLETGAFVGLVAPGETAIVLGGVVAAQGDVSLPLMLLLAWVAAALGDLASYALGRRLGRSFLVAHGPRVGVTAPRLATIDAFFDRHGGKAILIGRFVGLVRAVAPFLAGASKLPMRRFVPFSLLGTAVWASAFTLIGYAFNESFSSAAGALTHGALALAVVAAAVLTVRALRQRRTAAPQPAC